MFHLSFTCAVLALVLGFYGKGEIDYELVYLRIVSAVASERNGTEHQVTNQPEKAPAPFVLITKILV